MDDLDIGSFFELEGVGLPLLLDLQVLLVWD